MFNFWKIGHNCIVFQKKLKDNNFVQFLEDWVKLCRHVFYNPMLCIFSTCCCFVFESLITIIPRYVENDTYGMIPEVAMKKTTYFVPIFGRQGEIVLYPEKS